MWSIGLTVGLRWLAVQLVPGELVQVRYTKWGGRPHWSVDGTYLGADEHGHWLGAGPGTVLSRPGVRAVIDRHFVGLFPYDGWYTPTFYEPTDPVRDPELYVDISTVPEWRRTADGLVVTMADLDLDVIRHWDGTVVIDDADEFADHQVAYAYPAGVVGAAEAACAAVAAAARSHAGAFGGVAGQWLAECRGRCAASHT